MYPSMSLDSRGEDEEEEDTAGVDVDVEGMACVVFVVPCSSGNCGFMARTSRFEPVSSCCSVGEGVLFEG